MSDSLEDENIFSFIDATGLDWEAVLSSTALDGFDPPKPEPASASPSDCLGAQDSTSSTCHSSVEDLSRSASPLPSPQVARRVHEQSPFHGLEPTTSCASTFFAPLTVDLDHFGAFNYDLIQQQSGGSKLAHGQAVSVCPVNGCCKKYRSDPSSTWSSSSGTSSLGPPLRFPPPKFLWGIARNIGDF